VAAKQVRQVQMTLDGRRAGIDNDEHFGDIFPDKKPPRTLRLLNKNVQILPHQAFKGKSRSFVKKIGALEADVVALQEVGVQWDLVESHDTMYERLRRLSHPKNTMAHNRQDTHLSPLQYGGTGVITTTEATHRVLSCSRDPRNLGRWSSMLLSGKQQQKVRIVSVYNPCYSTGRSSVYQQQLRHIRSEQMFDKTPLSLLQDDLEQAISQWLGANEDLIICLDANEDVRSGKLTSMLRAQGLVDLILSRHKDLSPPATHARNQQDTPIDAIFTTLDVTADIKCGYTPFGMGLPGDHRQLWADIPFEVIFGYNPPNINSINAPRLLVQDPRCRKKYHDHVLAGFADHNIMQRTSLLREKVKSKAPVPEIKAIHHAILVDSYRIRRRAAKKCRRKRKGAIPWSPELQLLFDIRQLWTLIVKKKKRVRMSSKQIRRLMAQCNNTDAFQVTLEEAQTRRDLAHANFMEGKKQALSGARII
jgi:hypothetical protein